MKKAANRRMSWALGLLLLMPLAALADSGVLVPGDKQAPDPSILSLAEVQVDIHVDNGDARVWMRQVFTNHTGRPQEGNYLFALPGGTTISDFAVWDGPVRIPAVILERKRAKALYQELKSQAIDPGLLEQGERSEDDARRNSIFSVHIVPIPAYGTKRLEIEYHQRIPVEARKSNFLLPLKPDAYVSQKVSKLSIRFELHSAARMKDFAFEGKPLPFHIEQQDEHTIRGTVEASNLDLAEDVAAVWKVNEPGNALEVIAYRDPNPTNAGMSFGASADSGNTANNASAKQKSKQKQAPEPGFFEALAQLSAPQAAGAGQGGAAGGRTVVVLMDTSLSCSGKSWSAAMRRRPNCWRAWGRRTASNPLP